MTTEQAISRETSTRRSSAFYAPKSTAFSSKSTRFPRLNKPSQDRLDASLRDQPFDLENRLASPASISASLNEKEKEKEKTVLYLAYGSNLCAETFRGARGIRPLSQINVLVPELRLTFDLPGLPYVEPCFANSARRDVGKGTKTNGTNGPSQTDEHSPGNEKEEKEEEKEGRVERKTDYHKDRWHKGMVGCVYEVTLADYAHIIATEGGGSSYQDILVTCYALPDALDVVPTMPAPEWKPFKAHTLFAPAKGPEKGGYARSDPSYAQPSARYLKLLNDGADELSLPEEYKEYLADIRPYTITTTRQTLGKAVFMGVWGPFMLMIMALNKKLGDENGRAPKWLAALSGVVFKGMWVTYDGVFKRVFGDGERTLGDGAWGGMGTKREEEKERLLV